MTRDQHDDATGEACDPGTIVCLQQLANQHRSRDTQANGPGIRLQPLVKDGTAERSHRGRHDSTQPKSPTF